MLILVTDFVFSKRYPLLLYYYSILKKKKLLCQRPSRGNFLLFESFIPKFRTKY